MPSTDGCFTFEISSFLSWLAATPKKTQHIGHSIPLGVLITAHNLHLFQELP